MDCCGTSKQTSAKDEDVDTGTTQTAPDRKVVRVIMAATIIVVLLGGLLLMLLRSRY